MNNCFLPLLIFILFSMRVYAQDEKWIDFTDDVSQNGVHIKKTVHIATGEEFITVYPLKEVALWLYAFVEFSDNGKMFYSFVMSRIRFKCYVDEYTILSTYVREKRSKMIEVSNYKYAKGWEDLLSDSPLSRKIWKFCKRLC